MLIKNLTKKERYGALAAVMLIVIAVAYNFVIEPFLQQWEMLNNEIRAGAEMLKKDMKMLSSRKAFEADILKFSKYLKTERNEEETIAQMLSYIENVARSDSCLVVNMKPMGVRGSGSYKEIMVDVSAEGGLTQFSKFFYDIENTTDMILKVRRFTLTSKAGQPGALKGSFLISRLIIE